ncbi:MAG TPA: hypothetical protein VFI22_05555 [Thermomicrobiales bacterium]|nr:hypothetical protein [Thermomicrobiales bacterium]
MDANRFDRLTRRLTTPRASRRLIFGAAPFALGARFASDAVDAKKRCKKSKRCGKDCCGKQKCLPKKIDPQTGKIVSFACCSKKLLCRPVDDDPLGNQCCYSDETCRPDQNNNGNGLCCRECNGLCCPSSEFCQGDHCEPLGTARLPRRRGGG